MNTIKKSFRGKRFEKMTLRHNKSRGGCPQTMVYSLRMIFTFSEGCKAGRKGKRRGVNDISDELRMGLPTVREI